MATVITAGNATNGLSLSADNAGTFQFKTGTGAGTTALSIDASQNVTMAAAQTVTGNQTVSGTLAVTGTITGSSSVTGTNLFGQSQTWTNVTRTSGTTYTNSTGRPILISVAAVNATAGYLVLTINGVATCIGTSCVAGGVQSVQGVIPIGATYSYAPNGGTATSPNIYELR